MTVIVKCQAKSVDILTVEKTETKLTLENLKKINPGKIIYAEFADFGVMGDCGSAQIFTLRY